MVRIGAVSSSASRRTKKMAWHIPFLPKRTIGSIKGLAILHSSAWVFFSFHEPLLDNDLRGLKIIFPISPLHSLTCHQPPLPPRLAATTPPHQPSLLRRPRSPLIPIPQTRFPRDFTSNTAATLAMLSPNPNLVTTPSSPHPCHLHLQFGSPPSHRY
jgi:hypothetical protein